MKNHENDGSKPERTIFRYEKGRFNAVEHDLVREFPLTLIVNGRELAVLVASPHDLRYLVAGFLRLQGFVKSVEDFQMLSVCEDFGVANVIIKGELPEKLKPALTSGCGTGITFNLQQKMDVLDKCCEAPDLKVSPEDLYTLMDKLAGLAGEYRKSGGIHSAAVCEGRTILLHSEDIGRHNTLDRIAGEALLKGIDLSGKILITSGRVSTEMVAKAASLGVSLIATRTSPTDLAVRLAEEAGITMVGYFRKSGFNVYSHPQTVISSERDSPFAGVTAVILAGGESTRMKSNKSLLPYCGELFIERIHRQLSTLFSEVIIVTNTPELYRFLPCRTVSDIFPGRGSLGGIHAALSHSKTPHIFVVACDMPNLNTGMIERLMEAVEGQDVVIPESDGGLEPLHAVYGKGALPVMEEALTRGRNKIADCFGQLRTTIIARREIAAIDPEFRSFRNINTPEEYYRFRDEMRRSGAEDGSEENWSGAVEQQNKPERYEKQS